MSGRRRRVRDTLVAHPLLDHGGPILAVALWSLGSPGTMPDRAAWIDFLIGIATLAGLTMAAATFVCALTYQSSNLLMSSVRQHFGPILKRNWVSVISSSFLGAVVAVLAIPATSWSAPIALGAGLYALVLVSVKACRSVYWLTVTLFGDDLERRVPRTIPAPESERLHEAHLS